MPSLAVGDDMKEPLSGRHVVEVTRGNRLPRVPAWVSCRKTEGLQKPVLAVGPVVGEGLAGPLAGDQDAAPGIAEVLAAMRLAGAPAGAQALMGVLGLDAVAQPVRARRRAWLVSERVGQALRVILLGAGGRLVAVGHVFGEVFRQVSDAAGRVFRPAEHALSVELRPKPCDMQRLVIGADRV